MERRHGAAKHVEGIWWLSSKGVNCWIFLNLAVNFYELVTIDYIYIYITSAPGWIRISNHAVLEFYISLSGTS